MREEMIVAAGVKTKTLPLVLERDKYQVRLEPLAREGPSTEFSVHIKLFNVISISDFSMTDVKDLKGFINMKVDILIQESLRDGRSGNHR